VRDGQTKSRPEDELIVVLFRGFSWSVGLRILKIFVRYMVLGLSAMKSGSKDALSDLSIVGLKL
jgi:hypothetical protein